MKKKKVTAKKLMPAIFTVAVCACTVAGLGAASYLEGKPYKLVNDNGESYVSVYNKADIISNIYDKDGKLVILEIVPYENAGILEMLTGSDRVRNILEINKASLYQEFKSTEVDYGDVSTVTVGGDVASYHPFTIDYNELNGEYTVNYSNTFLNKLVDSLNDTTLYNYLAENIEVRTVVAGELTEEDLEDVSMIYLSSYVENEEIINFNRYINGDIGTNRVNMVNDSEGIGAFLKNGNSYTEISMGEAASAWYDSYVKDDNGNYISSDMSWDMVENIIEYVYAGNEYTDGQPIPCVVNYGTPVNTTANVYKLANLLLKTSVDEDAEFEGVSTYYRNVLADIKDGVYNYNGTEYSDWGDTDVPLFNITCTKTDDYLFNYVYKTDNSTDSLFFLMGSPFNFEETITDNGSAALRDVTVPGENYTTTDIIRYLLDGYGEEPSSDRALSRAEADEDRVYRVLEIQPSIGFMYKYTDGDTETYKRIKDLGTALGIDSYSKLTSEAQYKNLINNNNRIEFKHVSTYEFNGLNEDLVATYDIIIIGADTGNMQVDTNGKPIYNDVELDGYVYLAYGDLVKSDTNLLGFLPSDFQSIDDYVNGVNNKKINWNSFSRDYGTSCTEEWKGQKILYSITNANAWTPMLRNELSSANYWVFNKYASYSTWADYYDDPVGNSRTTPNDITEKKMNELIEFVDIDRPVILVDALYDCTTAEDSIVYPTSHMYEFISTKKSMPNIIPERDVSAKLLSVVHDNELKIISYSMQYQKDGAVYDAPEIAYDSAGLLLDSCIVENVEEFNYTVKFKAEKGKRYFVKAIIDKNTDGRFKSDATIDDFNEVYYAKIVEAKDTEVVEKLNIKLAENYNGMFAWKILIEELDSRNLAVDAVSEQGYTVVRGGTKHVKALQLIPSVDGTLIDMSTDQKTNSKTGTSNPQFAKLLRQATQKINYDVDIDSMTVDDFESQFSSSKKYIKGESYNTDANYLIANGYNMLIFGFADSYGGQDVSDDYGALSCIMDFAENGNSVLMAHDVLTFYASGNFGIGYSTSKNGSTTTATLSQSTTKNGSFSISMKMRDMIGMDVYSLTTLPNLDPETLEAANVPKKADGTYISEIQGFTNWHMYRYLNKYNYVNERTYGPGTLRPWINASLPSSTDVMDTAIVNEVNRGQISMYPFNTTSSTGTLGISITHAQYFRVDLEDDELVVWYTLGDDDSNYTDIYSAYGKDAANNYYIYSKGNITYTGAGHNNMNTISELKLFVNTTIRAAMAGNFTPSITITNGASTYDPKTFVVFPSVLDKDIVVQFEAFDEDLATREVVQDTYPGDEDAIREHIGRFQSGAIYYVDPDTGEQKVLIEYNRTTGPYLLNGEPTEFKIYNPYEGQPASSWNSLAASETDPKKRNMYDCYMQYINGGIVDLLVESSDYAGATGYSYVQVVQQELFPLD